MGAEAGCGRVQSGSIIQFLHYTLNPKLKTWMQINVGICCLLMRRSSATTGFGSLHINGCSPSAYTYTEFRLCQETGEKTEYFCKQFIELWAEYLKFNFEVGERLKCEMSEKELNKPCEKV